MQWHERAELPYLRFDIFPEAMYHAVLTRLGGVSEPPFASLNLSSSVADDPERLRINRERAYRPFGHATESLVHAFLIHGAGVASVTSKHGGQLAGRVDGLITDEPGCGLAMNFADCAPVLLYDPARNAIGLGHAGWQGVMCDLPGALVRAMTAAFGSDPARLLAGIGPCIGPCCYEVGEPVIGRAHASGMDAKSLLHWQEDRERPHFDLPAAARQRLEAAGVSQIETSGMCTACRTDLFFSHRAEGGRTGRFGVILALPDD